VASKQGGLSCVLCYGTSLPSLCTKSQSDPDFVQRDTWRTHHGVSDFKRAFDLAMGLSSSGEAAHAYLDWLTVVARDEIESQWPHVEKVAQALMRERTLTSAEVKALLVRA
jgi:hypothetical protein